MSYNSLIYVLFVLELIQPSVAHSLSPIDMFPVTSNKLTPSKYWLNNLYPYPTNAWFINFVLNRDGGRFSFPVNTFPYLVSMSPSGLNLSYTSPHSYVDPRYPNKVAALYYQFENQLSLGSSKDMARYGVASYHGLGVTLEWKNKGQEKITSPLLQGSPYLTEFFSEITPQLASRFKWLSVNNNTQTGPLVTATRYELVLALDDKHTQTWLLYSEKPIAFTWTVDTGGEKLTATQPYSGWLRLVLYKDTANGVDNDGALLDAYSQTIPLDYAQHYFSTDKNLGYSFVWQTQNNKPPLMLSLAHQRSALLQTAPVSYSGIKGPLLAETTAQWNIVLPKIPLQFLEPKHLTSAQESVIRSALHADAEQFLQQPFPDDGPYWVGKRYARAARLILIAHQLKEYTLQKKMIKRMEAFLQKQMLQKTTWHFQYDNIWGGIIPSTDNYGARHYNDHHFHYGYWVYAFAVIAQFDLKWMTKPLQTQLFSPKQWIEALIQDYANPDAKNPYFPMQRYQDDYAGHSWASGLVAFKDGQNQQSSSEAVNAYYALALYASVMKERNLFDWAEFLMTRELISAQTYWQIQKDSSIYSSQFTEDNQVVADLWASKIDSNAFFISCNTEYRCGLQYSFGIQMLPFTALSSYLLDKQWLLNAYPTLKKLINGQYGPISPVWQWILIKGITPIMINKEKQDFFNQAQGSKPENYDNGDSKTNTLYFLSTD